MGSMRRGWCGRRGRRGRWRWPRGARCGTVRSSLGCAFGCFLSRQRQRWHWWSFFGGRFVAGSNVGTLWSALVQLLLLLLPFALRPYGFVGLGVLAVVFFGIGVISQRVKHSAYRFHLAAVAFPSVGGVGQWRNSSRGRGPRWFLFRQQLNVFKLLRSGKDQSLHLIHVGDLFNQVLRLTKVERPFAFSGFGPSQAHFAVLEVFNQLFVTFQLFGLAELGTHGRPPLCVVYFLQRSVFINHRQCNKSWSRVVSPVARVGSGARDNLWPHLSDLLSKMQRTGTEIEIFRN